MDALLEAWCSGTVLVLALCCCVGRSPARVALSTKLTKQQKGFLKNWEYFVFKTLYIYVDRIPREAEAMRRAELRVSVC